MTPAERKEIKAGKHERMRKLLDNIHASRPKPMFEDQLMVGEEQQSATTATNKNPHR
jgi:hypothetical protein